MKHRLSTTITILSAAILSSCASLTTPERPAYRGADLITRAQSTQLLGKWTVNELNPHPRSEPQNTTIEYREDGTIVGTLTPQGESAQALGNLQFAIAGEWTLDDDNVVHQNVTMSSTSDSTMGDLISSMINNQKGISGRANIYELGPNRMVMVGTDGAAMEYIRQ